MASIELTGSSVIIEGGAGASQGTAIRRDFVQPSIIAPSTSALLQLLRDRVPQGDTLEEFIRIDGYSFRRLSITEQGRATRDAFFASYEADFAGIIQNMQVIIDEVEGRNGRDPLLPFRVSVGTEKDLLFYIKERLRSYLIAKASEASFYAAVAEKVLPQEERRFESSYSTAGSNYEDAPVDESNAGSREIGAARKAQDEADKAVAALNIGLSQLLNIRYVLLDISNYVNRVVFTHRPFLLSAERAADLIRRISNYEFTDTSEARAEAAAIESFYLEAKNNLIPLFEDAWAQIDAFVGGFDERSAGSREQATIDINDKAPGGTLLRDAYFARDFAKKWAEQARGITIRTAVVDAELPLVVPRVVASVSSNKDL